MVYKKRPPAWCVGITAEEVKNLSFFFLVNDWQWDDSKVIIALLCVFGTRLLSFDIPSTQYKMKVSSSSFSFLLCIYYLYIPLDMTLRSDFRAVVQFHLRFRNWYWHSVVPNSAPLTISCRTCGSFRHVSAAWSIILSRPLVASKESRGCLCCLRELLNNGRPGKYWWWAPPARLLDRLSLQSRIGSIEACPVLAL